MQAAARSSGTGLSPREVPLAIGGRYLSLTTYRRDGSPVANPVWFVEDGGRLYVNTGAESYKAKRIRENPAVAVAACSARGVLRGTPIRARAAFLPESEHAKIDELMARKYRLDRILLLPVYRLVTRLTRRGGDRAGATAYLVLTATEGDDHDHDR